MALNSLRTLPSIVKRSSYSYNGAISILVCRKLLIANQPSSCFVRHYQTQRDPNKWLYKRLWAAFTQQWKKSLKSIDKTCSEHTRKATRMAKEMVKDSTLAMESESYVTRYKELLKTKRREFYQKSVQPKVLLLKDNFNYSVCVSKCYIKTYGEPIRNFLLTMLCIVRDYSMRIGNSEWFRRFIGLIRKISKDFFDMIRHSLSKQKFLKDNPKAEK